MSDGQQSAVGGGRASPEGQRSLSVRAVEEGAGRRAEERRLVLKASAELAKKAMAETVVLAGKIGAGARALWGKIHVDRSPEAMLASLHTALDENQARRAKVTAEMEALHTQIAAKKKVYEGAAAVRQRMLKTELPTLLAHYKSLEREFLLLAENEQNILTVKGRFMELIAHGLRGTLDEGLVDRLADDIEDKAGDAESLQEAVGDLERAGRRRERDAGDFESELAGFGELETAESGGREPGVGETADGEREAQVTGRESRPAAERVKEEE